ncbi:MAG TPA: methylated-DNA--[protein]-cysteine S-methyltransferase [Methylomirabilota bacterium]|jgi:methylated-DNA-[protein]-cysteine S-methyltransferase|nr:methylated-DNA--[protein]-cysteine S-methyltransferase [Methylomirabilota bacterium]
MSTRTTCAEIEPDLIAAATGEAGAAEAERVDAHVAGCPACRDDFARYHAIDATVGALRAMAPAAGDVEAARQRLIERLADLRSRVLGYRVFDSPLGPILIARSEHGVALVEYLGKRGVSGSRLFRLAGVEAHEDATGVDRFGRELMEYFEGRRTHLDWPLDLHAARSDFERAVLQATAAVPYGTVASYRGIAGELGKPSAVRAVAQALRHNPLPIVVPCHRIIGSSGDLVGYAGHRLGLKEHLLGVEGVATRHAGTPKVERRTLYHYEPNPSREYCLPTCGDIARRPIGRLFATREQAEAAGLVPCTSCHPELHPLPS